MIKKKKKFRAISINLNVIKIFLAEPFPLHTIHLHILLPKGLGKKKKKRITKISLGIGRVNKRRGRENKIDRHMSYMGWLLKLFPVYHFQMQQNRVAEDKVQTEKTPVLDSTIISHSQSQKDMPKELISTNSEES